VEELAQAVLEWRDNSFKCMGIASLIPRPLIFSPHREKRSGEWPIPFYVGRPIMLRCTSEVIHGNNGDQESWAIEAVCRTLGYAVLKTDDKKAARGIVNGQDEFGAWQPTVESLNASKIASESLCWWKKILFPGSSFLGNQNLWGRQRNVSGRHYHVPQ